MADRALLPDTVSSDGAPAPAGHALVLIPDLLLIWLSPSFPVGAFAFSHGLEMAVEDRLVAGLGDLESWLEDVTARGSLRNDLILVAEAWRAVCACDEARLRSAADLALALQPSAERYLETVTQGNAFRATLNAAWPITPRAFPSDVDIAYPIAVAIGAAGHGMALAPLLEAYAVSFLSNLVSAAIRLGVIGQTDGQRTLASLLAPCRAAAVAAASSSLDDLGGATFAADLMSLRHESQYSRLFRS